MTDNTIVMHKLGVLRVQPQPKVTPAQRYSHRNGEREKPTVEGCYGFRFHNLNVGYILTAVEHMGEMRQYNGTRYDEEYTDLPDGYYWGPITGPWNEAQP